MNQMSLFGDMDLPDLDTIIEILEQRYPIEFTKNRNTYQAGGKKERMILKDQEYKGGIRDGKRYVSVTYGIESGSLAFPCDNIKDVFTVVDTIIERSIG